MATKANKHNRRKALIILFFPAIVGLWLIGWALYWIGHQQKPPRKPQRTKKQDNISLITAIFEEGIEIEN